MKKRGLFLVFLISTLSFSCSSNEKESVEVGKDELEIVKVDLSKAREGKLSEFFEPEIEYIWLKENHLMVNHRLRIVNHLLLYLKLIFLIKLTNQLVLENL